MIKVERKPNMDTLYAVKWETNGMWKDRYTITTRTDEFVLSTMGGFTDCVEDQNYLKKLLSVLIPMQMGDVEIPEAEYIKNESYVSEPSMTMKM